MLKLLFQLSALLFVFSSAIYSLDRIDLVKDCSSGSKCSSHNWYSTDDFKEDYLHINKPPLGAKLADKFPIPVKSSFPDTKSSDFTYWTEFEAGAEYLKENSNPALHIESIGDVYTVYLNGKLIGREGKVENGKTVYSRYGEKLKFPLNFSYFKEGKNFLVIHIQGNPKFYLMGLYSPSGYYFDDSEKIAYESRDRAGIVLYFLYLFVGAYHLFLYMKRRNEQYNLFFSFICLSSFIYMFCRGKILFEYGLDSTLGYRIEVGTLFGILPSFGFFFELLFFQKSSRIFKYYTAFCGVLFLFVTVLPQHLISIVLRIWQATALVCLIYFFFIFAKAIRLKSDSAKRLLFGTSILIIATIFDVLDSLIFRMNLVLSRYAFFFLIIGTAGILANRFINLHETVEDLNKNLEDKVAKRTKELQETLQEVRLLKEQQDGDYFLTTLIIKPLASNIQGEGKIHISALIRQKKKFTFRNRVHEIGGDICISDIITLKGRKYTAFVNGDAMGKSIQGAGGALVLGVVYKSILSRTRLLSSESSVYPERWLKSAFNELQNIFETFDGSMLISVVMGLADCENGFVYYINAEHPFNVLYRDGVTSFIENELTLRKIGMDSSMNTMAVHIRTVKLENRDFFLMGSDGRDDISLGNTAEGIRNINEDDGLFLKTVEEAEGDLEKIFLITEKKGALTDDFSLMKIEYHSTDTPAFSDAGLSQTYKNALSYYQKDDYKNAFNEISGIPDETASREVHILKANSAYKLKDYRLAANLYSQITDRYPEESSFLFAAAKSYKFSERLDAAADFAERLRLREPANLNVLILLCEIYLGLKNIGRVEKILRTAEKLDHTDPRIDEIRKMLS